jgi:hypothetical protein
MSNRIDAIWPKVDRAKQHIDDLKIAADAFYGPPHPCKADAEDDPKAGQCTYHVTYVRDIPICIPILIGDALQNLRTSLDYLARELVLAAGGTPTTRTAFPITESVSKYKSDATGKVLGMRQDVIDKIAALKPYKGGNEPLWQLHALNNIDKHRLLITCVATMFARTATGSEDGIPTFITQFFNFVPLKKGTVFRLPISKNQNNAELRCQIAFDELGVLQGESITDSLNKIADVVSNLITGFKPFLL